jgi:toxin ParE1/3/4
MALDLFFAPRARQDLQDILDFIAADDEQSAVRMLQRFEKTFHLVAEHPFIGPPAPATGQVGIRKISVPPYVIFYRIREPAAEIARILHSSRDLDLSALFDS